MLSYIGDNEREGDVLSHAIMETTLLTVIPISLRQVTLCQNHSFLEIPKENLDLQWYFYLPCNLIYEGVLVN